MKLLRQPGLWLLVLAVGVSFLALALGPAKAQRDGAMESCWTNHFPNWSKPWRFIDWTIFSTFEVIRYNVVTLGIGQAFVVLLAVGAYHSWKTRSEKIWLVVLLSPMLLVYLASCLHKYPFGGSRVEVFLAPALMWVIAAAIPPAYDWLKNRGRYQPLVLAVLLCAPVLQTGFRAAVDWPRADCATASDYVLNHCETHEALLINHWEFEYYLRNASSKPIYLENLKDHPEQCWVLIVGDKSEEREHDISTWIKNALVLEKKEFFRAIVLRVRFESGAVSAPLSAD